MSVKQGVRNTMIRHYAMLFGLALVACDAEEISDTGEDAVQDESDDPNDDVEDVDEEEDEEEEVDVSYADVEPILAAYCTGCHTEGGPSPFALDSYADAAPRAGRIVARAVDGSGGPMPPAGLALDDDEAAILEAWDAAGAPE